MIGLENRDSSFFTVESPDIELTEADFNKNLIALSISERMSAIPQGTLSFYDPKHYFSRVLRTGVTLKISWGYKNQYATPDSLIAEKLNFDEVSGQLTRRGYQGFVSSPTGAGSQNGVVTYNCNFSSFGFRGEETSVHYTTGTKKTVVETAFNTLGVSPVKRIIDFTLQSDAISEDKYVRQDESTFAFLNRMAIEWKAVFHIAFSPSGEAVGFFIDQNKLGTIPLPQWALEAGGASNAIGYMGELNNVKSYTWTSSESESGIGDNIRMDIVDGQIIFRRYVAEEETVITYRLDQKKIQEVYADAGVDGLGQQVKLTRELLSLQDFEQIKHYF